MLSKMLFKELFRPSIKIVFICRLLLATLIHNAGLMNLPAKHFLGNTLLLHGILVAKLFWFIQEQPIITLSQHFLKVLIANINGEFVLQKISNLLNVKFTDDCMLLLYSILIWMWLWKMHLCL